MYISARADYVTRALLVLAAAPNGGPITATKIAELQHMPQKFVENLLVDLKKSGLVSSVRGNAGGFRLARAAADITMADIIRSVDGPLAEIRGQRPEEMVYEGPAENLQRVWVAVRASLRSVLEHVTLEQIVTGDLPAALTQFSDDPDAWVRRI